ncbi:MAG: hypothetical protein KF727_08965 [Microbacteriaceae bacterium]|nr:hypothetical protein [Microbacteriaceae bacterium]
MPSDPVLRAALDRQAAVLAPISARLHAAVVHPPVAPHDWGGPAARGFAELEHELRTSIAAADDTVSGLLHATRIAAGRVDG